MTVKLKPNKYAFLRISFEKNGRLSRLYILDFSVKDFVRVD